MTDNQNTIETLQRLKKYFESVDFYLSANIVQEEIEELQPKPKYEVGKAYVLWSAWREGFHDAIYVGGERPWVSYDEHTQSVRSVTLHSDSYVVDTEKKEMLITEEDFLNAPRNTIVRRKDPEHSTWDVAVVNLARRWYLDGKPAPLKASDMAQIGAWEVVSSD